MNALHLCLSDSFLQEQRASARAAEQALVAWCGLELRALFSKHCCGKQRHFTVSAKLVDLVLGQQHATITRTAHCHTFVPGYMQMTALCESTCSTGCNNAMAYYMLARHLHARYDNSTLGDLNGIYSEVAYTGVTCTCTAAVGGLENTAAVGGRAITAAVGGRAATAAVGGLATTAAVGGCATAAAEGCLATTAAVRGRATTAAVGGCGTGACLSATSPSA